MQETGFADAHVPDDDVLEDIRVVVRPGSHLGSCLLHLGLELKCKIANWQELMFKALTRTTEPGS